MSLPEEAELQPAGTVTSIVQQLGNYMFLMRRERFCFVKVHTFFSFLLFVSAVIVQSLKDTSPLTDDSILFTSERMSVGKVGAALFSDVSMA